MDNSRLACLHLRYLFDHLLHCWNVGVGCRQRYPSLSLSLSLPSPLSYSFSIVFHDIPTSDKIPNFLPLSHFFSPSHTSVDKESLEKSWLLEDGHPLSILYGWTISASLFIFFLCPAVASFYYAFFKELRPTVKNAHDEANSNRAGGRGSLTAGGDETSDGEEHAVHVNHPHALSSSNSSNASTTRLSSSLRVPRIRFQDCFVFLPPMAIFRVPYDHGIFLFFIKIIFHICEVAVVDSFSPHLGSFFHSLVKLIFSCVHLFLLVVCIISFPLLLSLFD